MSDMATRAERILKQASAISADRKSRVEEAERLRVAEEAQAQKDKAAARAISEAKRIKEITEVWKDTGVIQLFTEIAGLKDGWRVELSENEIRLGYDVTKYESGMEPGDSTRYTTSHFVSRVRVRREVRNRLFRPIEQRWFVGDKQIGVDGTLEDLVAEALADGKEIKKTAEGSSNFQKGDWDCWRP